MSGWKVAKIRLRPRKMQYIESNGPTTSVRVGRKSELSVIIFVYYSSIFLSESLKQAVGQEAIQLLVNVDEDDYEAGRLKLLQNHR